MDMLEPGRFGLAAIFKKRYGNYIGGQWVPPACGEYFANITPVTGKPICEIPRSNAEDVERALDAAHAAKAAWGRTSPADRAAVLLRIADRMEQNLELLATAETWAAAASPDPARVHRHADGRHPGGGPRWPLPRLQPQCA